MTDHYNAFEMSPVPAPGPDAVAPELFRGIYGMPAFVTIPTTDLAASVEFWTRGLGFFELFGVPGRIVHLRRWVFQDVLLVPGETAQETAPGLRVSFACVLGQIEPLVAACRAWGPGTVGDPIDTPWNTRDVEIVTPENVRVVFTAAKPYEPGSVEAATLAEMGIRPPADTAEIGGGVDAG
ncbi:MULTISPECIES: VOC family protein [Microbacterium]|jgi:catechol 2,3-dioxygenase-like lactoylglutathione lyase family enzyme|uniref:VOC family protein n=1 Tax=Microbacterium TaxID=33882 RepID=UPI00046A547F|nr:MULTISPECIES: VOC family protein [Microbacterium]AMG82160.1 glycosyltransferase [Microbacterium sp. PAMC 28756]QXE29090.1 VOC family protein [Microbacterium paraoxydans]